MDPVEGSFVGMEIMSYILNHETVDMLATKLNIKYERGQKHTVIMDIILLMRKLWQVENSPRCIAGIIYLQQKWRKAILPDMGPYPNEPAVNEEDIFTMEPLTTIDKNKLFSFRENDQVFAFDASHLAKHVFVFKNTFNPLTREPIRLKDMLRLQKWTSIYIKDIADQAVVTKTWETPMMAFTEITSDFEREFGIFTQPQWYTVLDQYDIMTVFREYHRMAGRGSSFMDRQAEEEAFDQGDPIVSQMTLAKEMYQMIVRDDADNRMYYVCCLFSALASVSIELDDSLPHWIHDVVM
jgi:hypothetical protein